MFDSCRRTYGYFSSEATQDMASSEETTHGLAMCEDCESVQPVEITPDGGILARGNPSCECGNNNFRLLE